MGSNNIKAALEALLFIYGEPTKIKKLAALLKVDVANVEKALQEMSADLVRDERGLKLIIHDGEAALATKPEFGEILKQAVKEELDAELTPASLETLAIIAYLGPCSRAEIDYIRGVNSSFILRSLMVRGLIERKSDADHPNAFFYQVSLDFLRHVGISDARDLPEYAKYKELMAKLRQINENEVEQAK
jgi:segregation and condensation protein B